MANPEFHFPGLTPFVREAALGIEGASPALAGSAAGVQPLKSLASMIGQAYGAAAEHRAEIVEAAAANRVKLAVALDAADLMLEKVRSDFGLEAPTIASRKGRTAAAKADSNTPGEPAPPLLNGPPESQPALAPPTFPNTIAAPPNPNARPPAVATPDARSAVPPAVNPNASPQPGKPTGPPTPAKAKK